MQSDIHHYGTGGIFMRLGYSLKDAMRVAWSNQFTDELTDAKLYGIRTQCAIEDDWKDRTVQSDVIIPFHAPPGDDKNNPWMVTPNCILVRKLLDIATQTQDLIFLGKVLHLLQDSFSHAGFTGWQEKFNACYWFKIIPIPLPNVLHTDVGIAPDIVGHVWTDPRTGERIDNNERALNALVATYYAALKFKHKGEPFGWDRTKLIRELKPFFNFKSNEIDKRKNWLMQWSGFNVTYTEAHKQLIKQDNIERLNIRAARKQLSIVQDWMAKI